MAAARQETPGLRRLSLELRSQCIWRPWQKNIDNGSFSSDIPNNYEFLYGSFFSLPLGLPHYLHFSQEAGAFFARYIWEI